MYTYIHTYIIYIIHAYALVRIYGIATTKKYKKLNKQRQTKEMKLDKSIQGKKLNKNSYLILPVDFSSITNIQTYIHAYNMK